MRVVGLDPRHRTVDWLFAVLCRVEASDGFSRILGGERLVEEARDLRDEGIRINQKESKGIRKNQLPERLVEEARDLRDEGIRINQKESKGIKRNQKNQLPERLVEEARDLRDEGIRINQKESEGVRKYQLAERLVEEARDLRDEGEGERVEHDLEGIEGAHRDRARDNDHAQPERVLQERKEEHPRVGTELLALERQQPAVEVAEAEERLDALEVCEVHLPRSGRLRKL